MALKGIGNFLRNIIPRNPTPQAQELPPPSLEKTTDFTASRGPDRELSLITGPGRNTAALSGAPYRDVMISSSGGVVGNAVTVPDIFEEDIREFGQESYLRHIGLSSWDVGKWLKDNDIVIGSGYTVVKGAVASPIQFHDLQIKVEGAVFEAYSRWEKDFKISIPGDSQSLMRLAAYGEDRGIKISVAEGVAVPPELAEYLKAALDMFPDGIFQKYTREVWLTVGSYKQQPRTIQLDVGSFADLSGIRSRMQLIRHCLYRVVRDVSRDYGDRKHPLLAEGKKLEGHWYEGNYEAISGHKKSRADEKRYNKEKYEGDLPRDFLDRTVFNYIVDHGGLRDHIQKLSENPETRHLGEIYLEVFNTLKKEVFGGRTYAA